MHLLRCPPIVEQVTIDESGQNASHDGWEDLVWLLKSTVDDLARQEGFTHTALPFLTLLRASRPNHLNQGMLRPSFCLVVQGEKEILIGDKMSRYGEGCFVMSAVTLPTAGHIVQASADTPYLGICVNMELVDIAAAVLRTDMGAMGSHELGPAAYIAKSDPELLEAMVRLVRLGGSSHPSPGLAPVIMQEIVYRLIQSENGHLLSGMIAGAGGAFAISKAVEYIKANYTQPISVRTLAATANMSVSGFHHKFKTMTTVSPIQYQKKIRLLEARRMLLAGDLDAAMAAMMVGYESVT